MIYKVLFWPYNIKPEIIYAYMFKELIATREIQFKECKTIIKYLIFVFLFRIKN